MRNLLVPTAALLLAGMTASADAADLKSGLQIGDSAGAFNVKDCTGPSEGKSLCYR